MLFSPQDGTLIDPEFIPGIAAQYQMDFPKDVMQVGQEVWVSDQNEDLILRFDLIGNYVGVVRDVGFVGSPAGWTHTQTLQAVSIGGTANPTRLMLTSPIELPQGQTVGVYLVGTAGGVRYRSAATNVNNADLTLFSNTAMPFLFSGTPSTPRGFSGVVFYTGAGVKCYPDCNGDGALNLADFGCFQTKFALGDPYADCNNDGALNLADFGCFQTKFALGCP